MFELTEKRRSSTLTFNEVINLAKVLHQSIIAIFIIYLILLVPLPQLILPVNPINLSSPYFLEMKTVVKKMRN